MNDFDKHVKYLTGLAKTAFPDERGVKLVTPKGSYHGSAIVVVGRNWQLAGVGSHPRGWAGIEALLLALNNATMVAQLRGPPEKIRRVRS